MKKIILYILMLMSISVSALKRNVPGSYPSIQSALNACTAGDTVLVQPGIYTENIIWPSISQIKLFSAGDSSNTIIDANFLGRCLTFTDASHLVIDSNTVVMGFKLKNGYSDTSAIAGVAIYANGAWPSIKNTAIINCTLNALNSGSGNAISGGVVSANYDIQLNGVNLYGNYVYNGLGSIDGGILYTASSKSLTSLYHSSIQNCSVSINIQNSSNGMTGALIFGNKIVRTRVMNNFISYQGTSSTGSALNGLISSNSNPISIIYSLVANNTFSTVASVDIPSFLISCNPAATLTGSATLNVINATLANNKAYTTGTISALVSRGEICVLNLINTAIKNKYNILNSILYNPFNTTNVEINDYSSYIPWTSQKWIVMFNILRGYYNAGYIYPQVTTSVNPQFVSSTDFHLQNNSAAINLGTFTSYSSDIDFTNVPLPANTFPDAGCFECNQPTSYSLSTSYSISSNNYCIGSTILLTNTTPNIKNIIWTNVNTGFMSAATGTYYFPIVSAGAYTINLQVCDTNNVIGLQSIYINVLPTPTVSIASATNVICAGNTLTLIASGANTYSWNTGATNTTFTTAPFSASTYSCIGYNSSGCPSSTSTFSIAVKPLPSVSIISSNSITCIGQTATLTASGGNNYAWNGGSSGTNPTFIINPSATSQYTVSVTDTNNCVNTAFYTQHVSACVSIKEIAFENEIINIFPNPANDVLNVEYAALSSHAPPQIEVTILNALGEIVSNEEVSSNNKPIQLKTSAFAEGIYLLKLNIGGGSISKRFVIKR